MKSLYQRIKSTKNKSSIDPNAPSHTRHLLQSQTLYSLNDGYLPTQSMHFNENEIFAQLGGSDSPINSINTRSELFNAYRSDAVDSLQGIAQNQRKDERAKKQNCCFSCLGAYSIRWYLSSYMEYNLIYIIFQDLFDSKSLIQQSAIHPSTLKRRSVLIGIVNLLFIPFILSFTLIHHFLRFTEEYYSKMQYLGPRWLSPYAIWQCRNLNELPHLTERRLLASIAPSELYLKLFPASEIIILISGVNFIAAAFIAIILVIGLIDESLLVNVHIGGRNLLWYAPILTIVVSICRSFIPSREESIHSPNVEMRNIASFTHYLPDRWIGMAHTYKVRDEFLRMSKYNLQIFASEILGIFTAPIILCFVLPFYANDISAFINRYKRFEDGIGDICTFSLLKLSDHGDPDYGSKRTTKNDEKLFDGKLEKSWLSFHIEYSKDPLLIHTQNDDRDFLDRQGSSLQSENEFLDLLIHSSLSDSVNKADHVFSRGRISISHPEKLFFLLDSYHEDLIAMKTSGSTLDENPL